MTNKQYEMFVAGAVVALALFLGALIIGSAPAKAQEPFPSAHQHSISVVDYVAKCLDIKEGV